MNELLGSLLSNDSAFGRLMTRCGVIIGGNILFVIFSIPMVTIGASSAALHFVMLKALRGDGQVNPFKAFWKGFRENFLKATAAWLILLAVAAFLFIDLRICTQAGPPLSLLRYPLYAMLVMAGILAVSIFPAIAAFEDTLPHLFRNAFYIVFKRAPVIPVLLFFNFFPLYLTYTDPQMMPLYAFLWVFFGYGAIAMLNSYLLLPAMKPWLPLVDEYGDFVLTPEGERQKAFDRPLEEGGGQAGTGAGGPGGEPGVPGQEDEEGASARILEDMKRLGM